MDSWDSSDRAPEKLQGWSRWMLRGVLWMGILVLPTLAALLVNELWDSHVHAETHSAPVTFDSLVKSEAEDTTSGGAVTVSTSLIDVVDSCPTVTGLVAGNWVYASGHVHITKGATGGSTTMKLYQKDPSGDATLDWLASSGSVYGLQLPSHAANILAVWYFSYWLRVETAGDGTLQLCVQASSAGSDSSVSNGGATINVKVIR